MLINKKSNIQHVIWNNSASKSISYLKTREQMKNHEEVNMNKKNSCNKSTLLNVSIQVSINHTYLVFFLIFFKSKRNLKKIKCLKKYAYHDKRKHKYITLEQCMHVR